MNPLALFVALVGALLFSASVVLPIWLGAVLKRMGRQRSRPTELRATPSVTVIIPAYLESGVIGRKVEESTRALSRAGVLGEVIVVASDMETALAAGAADLVIHGARGGKAAACNEGVAASHGEVIVLTDANCRIGPDDWVSRTLELLGQWSLVSANKTEVNSSESAFWWLERKVKRGTAGAFGTLAVAGEFMASRRADYRPLEESLILDDFAMAADISERGLGVTVADDIWTEESAATPHDQWERRVRIAEGLLSEAVPRAPSLVRSPAGLMFVAHKLYRVTLGCIGFWIMVGGATFAAPVVSFLVPIAALYAVLAYAGHVRVPHSMRGLSTVVGLQFVPVAATWRLVKRRLAASDDNRGLWAKVAR